MCSKMNVISAIRIALFVNSMTVALYAETATTSPKILPSKYMEAVANVAKNA